MGKRLKRIISSVVALEFFLFQISPVCWALNAEKFDPKKVSVAVIPYPSSEQVRPFITETAEAIRRKLEKIPYFHIVKPSSVEALVNYHADFVADEPNLTDAEKYLGLAKTHWFDRQYKEAEATVDAAIQSFRRQPGKGNLLVDALLTKALVLKETRRFDESKAVFQEILKVNPSLTMEGLPITGRSKKVFNETRHEVLERLSGSLEIKTDPPATSVYLNGIRKGVTPLKLSSLPEGSYLMTIEASHYGTISEPVVVTANTTQFINRKLYWIDGRTRKGYRDLGIKEKNDAIIQNEIKMAAKIGETLKVDKVILVSSEKRGKEDLLVVRTIDTVLQAAYNPIGMSFNDFLADKEMSAQKLAGDLDDQAKIHVLNNPSEYFDPDMGNIRILRRKRPFTKSPAFYTLIGLVVGGAIGATTAILLSDDDNNGTSDGTGGAEIEFR